MVESSFPSIATVLSSPIALREDDFSVTCDVDRAVPRTSKIWLLEDDRGLASKRGQRAVRESVCITLHSIEDGVATLHSAKSISASEATVSNACVNGAKGLACEARESDLSSLLVTGTSYGCSALFLRMLNDMEARFAVKLRPATIVKIEGQKQQLLDILSGLEWKEISLVHSRSKTELPYSMVRIKGVSVADVVGDLIVARSEGLTNDFQRGIIFGFSNALDVSDEELLLALHWPRWMREMKHRKRREKTKVTAEASKASATDHDDASESQNQTDLAPVKTLGRPNNSFVKTIPLFDSRSWQTLQRFSKRASMVELFAGAGGMALGFLQAEKQDQEIDLLFSGEIEPIYAHTLRTNHRKWNDISGKATLPSNIEAVDLATEESFDSIKAATRGKGDVSIVVGGPPCQGFSAANRNSWSSDNPNNRLVEVFFRHVEAIKPRVFLMENVQGILWTNSQNAKLSVASELQQRLEKEGYITFPHLLDAAWFGVPQHRFRYFLLGIHRDTGYKREDFGENGPFPAPTHGSKDLLPFVTVENAIGDLPSIGNNQTRDVLPYVETKATNAFLRQMREHAPEAEITDHLTSRHADYVIERYRAIPEGGNWQDIKHLMTNYAEIDRTHSNIYRRLKRNEPSITMGHYRKSMLIHPLQDRGLSLREAMRLQSFPDWYRFAGNAHGRAGGLVHQQQQLANAVCPLLLRAIAGEILKL